MKATFYLLTIIFFSICFVACEKDNLDIAPNATFGGEIRDMETGELVEQEIIRGSQSLRCCLEHLSSPKLLCRFLSGQRLYLMYRLYIGCPNRE